MVRHHTGKTKGLVIAVLAAGLSLMGTSHGEQVTGIVTFGDSLSDVGNYYAATGGASPPTAFGYAQGEFTNGLNWVQYLAQDLGVAAPTASVNGGTDYAYGGAMTGDGTTLSTFGPGSATVPNMGQQISDYLGSNTPTAGQLYTLWGGANDVLNGGQTNPTVLLQNLGSEITTLAMAGAKQFLIGNLPMLNLTPVGLSLPPAEQAELAQFSYYFNLGLSAEAASLASTLGVKINVVDVDSLLNSAIANSAAYGFTDVTDPEYLTGNSGNGYLFWDIIHPTTQADQLIGNLAASQVVPEPSSMVLLASALMAMGAGARWQRSGSARGVVR